MYPVCPLTCPHNVPPVDLIKVLRSALLLSPFPPFRTMFNLSRPDMSLVCLGWTLRCTPPTCTNALHFSTYHNCLPQSHLRTGLLTTPQWFVVRSSVLEVSCHSAAAGKTVSVVPPTFHVHLSMMCTPDLSCSSCMLFTTISPQPWCVTQEPPLVFKMARNYYFDVGAHTCSPINA